MKNIWLLIFSLCFTGCDGDPYSGFGSICTEGHPAVAHARSLSEEQLSFLYKEMFRLRKENEGKSIEYGHFGQPIPNNLQFLKAVRIRPNEYKPNIMLAGCMDEYIYLKFTGQEEKTQNITLTWAAGTNENPYAVGKQVLWSAKK